MKIPAIIVIILLVFISSLSNAQISGTRKGHLEVIQDSRIDTLLKYHILHASHNPGLEGYRIQIFFDAGTKSKENAYEVRDKFLAKFPDMNVYISFREPYYRVRVGDFRTRFEAEGFLHSILKEYPNAFTIKDQINPPRIY